MSLKSFDDWIRIIRVINLINLWDVLISKENNLT